jgi:hypothetical protein
VADPKHEETFKVIDRRHFTEEGNLRPEAVELERREEEAAAKEAAAKKATPRSQPRLPNRIPPPRAVRIQVRRALPQLPPSPPLPTPKPPTARKTSLHPP